jgi:cyclopropane fatty-acyl-phospholipid synthase-like methyltransferase
VPSDFDARASTWDSDPEKVRRAQAAATAIRAAVPLDASTRLLEYGAGTGLVAQFLAPDVGSVTLAEPSSGMRAVMADKIADARLPASARVWDLDLTEAPAPDERFDVIVSVMTLHHVVELTRVLESFVTLLSGGGHLCVVDLQSEDGSFHRHDPAFEGHHGFAVAELTERLQAAGFVDVQIDGCGELEKDGTIYPLFLAVAGVTSHPSA